jgi:hypothetical protein
VNDEYSLGQLIKNQIDLQMQRGTKYEFKLGLSMNTLDVMTSLIAFLEPFMSTKETYSFFDVS